MAATMLPLLLAAVLAAEPAPAPKLIVDFQAEVDPGDLIVFDAHKSENVKSVTWLIWPRRARLVVQPQDQLQAFFSSGKPGLYQVSAVASGIDGQMTREDFEVRVNYWSRDAAESLFDPNESGPLPAPRRQTPNVAETQAIPEPDQLGLRPKVLQWYGEVSGHNKHTERARITTALDTAAAKIATGSIADQDARRAAIDAALKPIDAAVIERWDGFLDHLEIELSARDPKEWVTALRTISGSLRGPQ